jgi:hypothetical protein
VTIATIEIGIEETDNMTKATTIKTVPRLHRAEEEVHTEIEIEKATDHPVMIAAAEAGAEARAKKDHDDTLHHPIRRS